MNFLVKSNKGTQAHAVCTARLRQPIVRLYIHNALTGLSFIKYSNGITWGRVQAFLLTLLKINTLWDGLFHLSTYIFVTLGLIILWRAAHQRHMPWSGKMLFGTILLGFGVFNVVEGIVDHHVLGIPHLNETVPAINKAKSKS